MSIQENTFREQHINIPILLQQDSDRIEHDEGVYFTTNEGEQKDTIRKLSEKHINTTADTIVGVSGLCTLNIGSTRAISQKNINHLIMIDCSKHVQNFWKNMEKIIKESQTRQEAHQKIENLIDRKKFKYYSRFCQCRARALAEDHKRSLKKEIESDISWLSDNRRFERIKGIFDANHFKFFKLDLFEPQTMDPLVEYMKGKTLDFIYLSNVGEYAENSGKLHKFRESLAPILNPARRALIVDTRMRSCCCEKLTQKVFIRNKASLEECFPESSPKYEIETMIPKPTTIFDFLPLQPQNPFTIFSLPKRQASPKIPPELLPGSLGIRKNELEQKNALSEFSNSPEQFTPSSVLM